MNGNLPYVVAVAVIAVIGVTAAIVVTFLRPETDNVTLIGMLFGFLTPTTMALLAFMKAQQAHLSVNSRLDAMMVEAKAAARAEGHEAGRLAQQVDNDRHKQENP